VGATNKAKLEWRDCTRFPQRIQQRDVVDDKGLTPLDKRANKAQPRDHHRP